MTEKYPLYQQVLSKLRDSGSMYSWVPKPDKKGLRLSKDNKGMFLFSRCLNDMDRKQKSKINNNTWAFKTFRKYCVGSFNDISKITYILFRMYAIMLLSSMCNKVFLFMNRKWSSINITGNSNGKESACKAGDLGSIPGSGRSPGEGNDHPLQYSCLENSMDTEVRVRHD